MTKRFGFTLAEVLITLGIIGVVAAMTMPTLMNQTNGAQYKAAYKKALSAIAQGVTLNVALDGGNFADIEKGTGGSTAITADSGKTTIAHILGERMNVVRVDATPGYTITNASTTAALETIDTVLFFNDSSIFAFKNATETPCTVNVSGGATGNACKGYIDVNGAKGPNKVVQCDTAASTAYDTWAANTTNNTYEKTDATACTVSNPTDVYPVFYYDQTILPATNAAKAVLYGK